MMGNESSGRKPSAIDVQIKEIERELAARARVYPRLIDKGSLSSADAARQTAVLQDALATLKCVRVILACGPRVNERHSAVEQLLAAVPAPAQAGLAL